MRIVNDTNAALKTLETAKKNQWIRCPRCRLFAQKIVSVCLFLNKKRRKFIYIFILKRLVVMLFNVFVDVICKFYNHLIIMLANMMQ